MVDKAPTLRSSAPGNDRAAYDKAYAAKRKTDPVLAEIERLRGGKAFKTFRAWFNRRHPLCWLCEREGRTQVSEAVHHIRGLAENPEDLIDESKCVGLCRSHHAEINAAERRGENTEARFADWKPSND